MKTSIKALLAATASAALLATSAVAGGKGDIVLEPEVAAEDDVIVPAAGPSLPANAGLIAAAGLGAVALAVALSDDDDDDDDTETTTTPDED